MENKIISPCISVCVHDPYNDFCYGCGRTQEDKKIWIEPQTTNEWKEKNLIEIIDRLEEKQKKSFELQYQYKLKNGISPIKEKKLKLEKGLFKV